MSSFIKIGSCRYLVIFHYRAISNDVEPTFSVPVYDSHSEKLIIDAAQDHFRHQRLFKVNLDTESHYLNMSHVERISTQTQYWVPVELDPKYVTFHRLRWQVIGSYRSITEYLKPIEEEVFKYNELGLYQ